MGEGEKEGQRDMDEGGEQPDEDMNFTVLGCEHKVQFVYCSCEPLVMTMVCARLWPATPQHPRLAFCFELLDWAEVLFLECQVAPKDLCKAIQFKCPHLATKVCIL